LSLPHPASSDAEAFVLAGGRSSRMGEDKALVRFNGEPLIQHAVEVLRSAGFEPRIAGARSDLTSFAPVVPDDPNHPRLGPLSGICSAIDFATCRYAVFLPVDLPLLPASLITYMVHHAEVTGSAITIASICGFLETFPVVIDGTAAPVLKSWLQSQDRKCLNAFRAAADALQRPFSVMRVELLVQAGQVSDPRCLPPRAWFLSINTPADLVTAKTFLPHRVQLS
jgi:molybdopterin-guanine dinucleotide biosynthesis protein A